MQPSKSDNLNGGHSPAQLGKESSKTLLQDTKRLKSAAGAGDDSFSSLQLQGGDITREVYRWTEDAESASQRGPRGKRSRSFMFNVPNRRMKLLTLLRSRFPAALGEII